MSGRVVVLGGAGAMGRAAVRRLAAESVVDQLVVADLDLEAAEGVVREVEGPLEAAEVDVRNAVDLAGLFRGADLVCNTVGPFTRFAVPVMEAAIAARVDYCDICDDVEPTRRAFEELGDRARAAGIRLLVGMGASPGLSNLVARWAYEALDDVEELHTAWVAGGEGGAMEASGGASAALEHMLLGAVGQIPVWKERIWQNVPSFRDPVRIDFPGTGPYHCYPIGHPEPLTLPRFLEGLGRSVNYGALSPSGLNELVRFEADRIQAGEVDAREAARDFVRRAADDPRRWLVHEESGAGGLCAVAIGRRDGRRVQLSVTPAGFPEGGMATVTGYPLALAARALLSGEVRGIGVLAPEGAFEPEPFLGALSDDWDVRLGDGLVITEEAELPDG